MEGVQVVGNSQCSVAFRKQYSLQVSLEHEQRRSVNCDHVTWRRANARGSWRSRDWVTSHGGLQVPARARGDV